MSFEEAILNKWLLAPLSHSQSLWLIGGFEQVARHLGDTWIITAHEARCGEASRCLMSAVHVASIGWMLERIRHATGFEILRSKIMQCADSGLDELPAPLAELQGLYLVDLAAPGASIEYEPTPPAGAGSSIPDARFEWTGGAVTYLEVTRRLDSQLSKRVLESLRLVSNRCEGTVPPGLAAQVRLARPINDEEADAIVHLLSEEQPWTERKFALPSELGDVITTPSPDGWNQVTARPSGVDMPSSRCWSPPPVGKRGNPLVSIESTDSSIELLVDKETSQLPRGFPGIVLVQCRTSTRMGATWINRLRNEFASGVRCRPGGAWSFFLDTAHVPDGSVPPFVLTGGLNSHAEHPLPQILAEGMCAMLDKDADMWAANHPQEI